MRTRRRRTRLHAAPRARRRRRRRRAVGAQARAPGGRYERPPADGPRRPTTLLTRLALLLALALAPLLAPAPPAQAQTRAGLPADVEPLPPDWDRPLESIAAVLADADGDLVPDRLGAGGSDADRAVLVAGRVTAGSGMLRSDVGEVYVQDGTAGLRLLLAPGGQPVVAGDSVLVHGALSFRAGMAEIAVPSVRHVPSDARLVPPRALAEQDPNLEAFEGELVEVHGDVIQVDSVGVAGRTAGHVMLLLSGKTTVQVFVYARRASPFSLDRFEVGDFVRVRGIAAQHDLAAPFNGGYVVYPLAEAGVKRVGVAPSVYRWGALAIASLLAVALLWGFVMRRLVRRQTERLHISERRYGHLFDAVADPVVVLDGDKGARVLEANLPAQRAFGVASDGTRGGAHVLLAALAADSEEAAFHLSDVHRLGSASTTLELHDADGARVPYEVSTRLLDLEGARVLVSVARDVAERRTYELGLLQAMQTAEEAREEAEAAAALKSAILANMSHEIRTPLTAILGFSDILREEVEEDLREFAETVHGGATRLLHTLNDILDYARLDADAETLVAEPFDVVAHTRESVQMLGPLAQERSLALHFSADAPSYSATQSATAVGRVLVNLVGNAIKFTERGEVAVTFHAAEDFFALRIRDTGRGISDGFLPDLFEAFTQESGGHDRSHEGTGLGLSITKRLVELMGGTIRVWSKPGEGTLFEVSLPRSAPGAITSFGVPTEVDSPAVWQGASAPGLPHLGNLKQGEPA